ncbi:MAG: argininosuccinate lyase, partial [Gammaproteobacteria bacterium]|nr:argininosuccinate lyase [Gammaproteobacteria bacterium]
MNKPKKNKSQENKPKENKPKKNKPWGGRFTASTDTFVEQFSQSVSYDQRLYLYDIMGSVAHVSMLAKVGVLSREESDQIIAGLESIKAEITQGNFEWETTLEDVHMNIETALVARIGEVGKKLH